MYRMTITADNLWRIMHQFRLSSVYFNIYIPQSMSRSRKRPLCISPAMSHSRHALEMLDLHDQATEPNGAAKPPLQLNVSSRL